MEQPTLRKFSPENFHHRKHTRRPTCYRHTTKNLEEENKEKEFLQKLNWNQQRTEYLLYALAIITVIIGVVMFLVLKLHLMVANQVGTKIDPSRN